MKLLPFLCLLVMSCNYVTYQPRSKKQRMLDRPSALIFDRIIDFRTEQMGWPTSREDFTSKGTKYAEVFKDFRYLTTSFKRIDSNHMVFYFNDYVRDVENAKHSTKADLNAAGGQVKFYKENDKFLWKLKMY